MKKAQNLVCLFLLIICQKGITATSTQLRSENILVKELGVKSLTPLPGARVLGSANFAQRKIWQALPWQGRHQFAIGPAIQSFVEAVPVTDDQYLISTLGGGISLF